MKWKQAFFALLLLISFCSFKKVGTIGLSSTVPTIVLDAGHGGYDLGARMRGPYMEEKRLALITAHFTKRYLEQLGYRVILTRGRDFYLPLKRRVEIANRVQGDLFVSIHFNSCPNRQAKGIEIFYHSSDIDYLKRKGSLKLAKSILSYTTARTKAASRGIKDGNLCVIRETQMPAILFEGGFLTHPEEKMLLCKRGYLQLLSKGIAEGVHHFFRS